MATRDMDTRLQHWETRLREGPCGDEAHCPSAWSLAPGGLITPFKNVGEEFEFKTQ